VLHTNNACKFIPAVRGTILKDVIYGLLTGDLTSGSCGCKKIKIDRFFNMLFDDFIIAVPMWTWSKFRHLGSVRLQSFPSNLRSESYRKNSVSMGIMVSAGGFRNEYLAPQAAYLLAFFGCYVRHRTDSLERNIKHTLYCHSPFIMSLSLMWMSVNNVDNSTLFGNCRGNCSVI
jgi:hypothetical protein